MYTQLLQNQSFQKVINLSKTIDNNELVNSNEFLASLTPEQLNLFNNIVKQDDIK